MPESSRKRYVIPYDSKGSAEGLHSFQYWSLDAHFDIRSPYAFRRGDVVEVVEVNEDGKFVLVLPASDEGPEPRLLVFVSNDIPLNPSSVYEFSYSGCESVAEFECEDEFNKFYTMLLGIDARADYASVNAFCRQNRTKLTFHIGVNNG